MSEQALERESEVYSGAVPVVLKHPEREDKAATLTVALSLSAGHSRHQQVLRVQLTDENDPYLLYTLNISEDDFHLLKTEQSILVDFATFPSKLVELLRRCQEAADDDHPKFLSQMSTLTGVPIFTITETNPFRQLAHLALRFVAGNDASIKKYLASRLGEFKSRLASTIDELTQQTEQLQETASLATRQGERLRTVEEEHARLVSALNVRHSSDLAEAKERALNAQHELRLKSDQERATLVLRHETEIAEAKRTQSANEAKIAQLTACQHELELQVRERSNRLESVEQDAALLRQQNSALREENTTLSASKHLLEKSASARDVELSALTQSVRDKEELLVRTCSQLEAAEAAKRQNHETLEFYKENNFKLQENLKASAAEITKGNQIIGQLQGEVRAVRAKLRLKMAAAQQQQEQIAAKQHEVDTRERTCGELRAQIAELNAAKERSEESLATCRQQLTEAQDLLRSNQQVIQWLNKELNDAQTGQRMHGANNALTAVSSLKAATTRPALPSSVYASASDTTSGLHASGSSVTGGNYAANLITSTGTLSASHSTMASTSHSTTAGLRSRAGLAFVENSNKGQFDKSPGFSDFSQYLNPSSTVH